MNAVPRLLIAQVGGWIGLGAGLLASGAVPPRFFGQWFPIMLVMIWTWPGMIVYAAFQRWLKESWPRLFGAALLVALLTVVLSNKLWWGMPPEGWLITGRYVVGAAAGASLGFWCGLKLVPAPEDQRPAEPMP